MSIISIALLQLASNGINQQANLEKGERYCRLAASMGADLALFPELWNIGYTFFDPKLPADRERWASLAIRTESPFVNHFRNLAEELKIAIGLTYLQEHLQGPRNVISLIDRHGDILFTYAKVHTCDFDVESALTPGNDFFVADLDTEQGSVKVGAMICYDREFPESARILMLKGAEIILVPNSCDLEINRLSQLRSRSFENMVAIALTNYVKDEPDYGHSIAYDGMAFDEKEGSRDMLIVEADDREGVYLADVDINALRDYRMRETWGNAFRKPEIYRELVSKQLNPPFLRKEARR